MGPIAGILLGAVASKLAGGSVKQGVGQGLSDIVSDYGRQSDERERKRQALQARIGGTPQGGIIRENPYAQPQQRQVAMPQTSLQPYAAAPIGGRYRF